MGFIILSLSLEIPADLGWDSFPILERRVLEQLVKFSEVRLTTARASKVVLEMGESDTFNKVRSSLFEGK